MIAAPKFKEEDGELLAQIAGEIRMVDEVLARRVTSSVELVENIGRHTFEAGGKRLRPAFVALAARASGHAFDPARVPQIGACMEMIHMATLIHDDVIDHAATRRGRTTASAVYGNTAAVLAGDVLLSKAMVILAEDGDLEVIRTVSRAVVEIAEGEVRELELRGCYEISEAEHLQVLRMKTASFIECCCKTGALIAGASESAICALGAYGHHIGMAFQIVDDVLDYRSTRTGKPRAGDFREGQATLPLIYLRSQMNQHDDELTRRAFGNGASEEEIDGIVSLMDSSGAFERAVRSAEEHVGFATAALKDLADTPEKGLLSQVGDFVLSRQS